MTERRGEFVPGEEPKPENEEEPTVENVERGILTLKVTDIERRVLEY